MGLEGELRVVLRLAAGRVLRCDISSTRPDVARLLLQGRSLMEISAAVPRLFTVCAAAQSAACELVVAAVCAKPLTDAALERLRKAVADESLRETVQQVVLNWPRCLGEEPGPEAIAAARLVMLHGVGTTTGLDQVVFGVDAERWLAITRADQLWDWADAGATTSARFMRDVAQDRWAGEHEVALLPAPVTPMLVGEIVQGTALEADFAQRPRWHGAPAETGALARMQHDPLLHELCQRDGHGAHVRFAARLRELALMLTRRDGSANWGSAAPPAGSVNLGSMALPDGGAVSWVESVRGLLVHQLVVEGTRAARYGIVAPTEWNFHPAGALAKAFQGSRVRTASALRQRAQRWVQSLDPCVACQVEVCNA